MDFGPKYIFGVCTVFIYVFAFYERNLKWKSTVYMRLLDVRLGNVFLF